MRVLRFIAITFLMIVMCNHPAQAGNFGKFFNNMGRELGKSMGNSLQKDINRKNRELRQKWQKERKKIQGETCQLLKDNLIKKRYKREDLEDIRDFITSRFPKDKKKHTYISIIEEIGYKLIDNDLTITDYELIKGFIERIARTWSKRPWYEELFYRLSDIKKPGRGLASPGYSVGISPPVGF